MTLVEYGNVKPLKASIYKALTVRKLYLYLYLETKNNVCLIDDAI